MEDGPDRDDPLQVSYSSYRLVGMGRHTRVTKAVTLCMVGSFNPGTSLFHPRNSRSKTSRPGGIRIFMMGITNVAFVDRSEAIGSAAAIRDKENRAQKERLRPLDFHRKKSYGVAGHFWDRGVYL